MKDTFDIIHIPVLFSFIRVEDDVHLEDEVNGTQQVRSE